jgi:pseudaminic acid synthase
VINFEIYGREIGKGHPAYIIAEMSANHNQDFDLAIRIMEEAKKAGADAVKLQTFTAETHTIRSEKPDFIVPRGTLWEGASLFDLYSDASMPWEWQPKLAKIARELQIDLFSSVVDETSLAFLERIGMPAYKISSFELVDLDLLRKVARNGKPMILSTGMATLTEIDEALGAIRAVGPTPTALLKCTSAYPAKPEEMNLRTIPHMAEAFDVPVGLSDHTMGHAVAIAGVVLGACIVEKHFTLSRSIPSPDAAFSLEPSEFRQMVDAIRIAQKSLGDVRYEVTKEELPSRVFRRSLYAVADINEGEEFTRENIRSIRPGHGLHPRYLNNVLGRRAKMHIGKGTPLSWDIL